MPSPESIARRLTLARRVAQALMPVSMNVRLDVRPVPEGASMARAVVVPAAGVEARATPVILHLPATVLGSDGLTLACAAHAMAHLVHGAAAQSRRGLKPVQQALLGVLEDARVEYLAMERLPGLRRWWAGSIAEVGESRGQSFEDLLARLAWVLHDPVANRDPHPWIRKVHDLFFDPDGRLALRDPQDLRQVASRLGHDIGQMRLPFNARTYMVAASYRDDNTCLWLTDEEDRAADDPLFEGDDDRDDHGGTPPPSPEPHAPREQLEVPDNVVTTWYPEWDQRIRRLRPRWCRVLTEDLSGSVSAGSVTATDAAASAATDGAHRRRLGRWLQVLQPRHGGRGGRAAEGEELHPVAMVDHVASRRHQGHSDGRVFHAPVRRPLNMGVLLVIDASASAQLQMAEWQRQAWTVAGAISALGCQVAVWRFGSDGRLGVRVQVLKNWASSSRMLTSPPPAPGMLGSTRVGPVVRHAVAECALMARRRPTSKWRVVVLSDGDWHDTDVHEAGYLDADLVKAVEDARGLGVQVHLPVAHSDWTALSSRSWTRRISTPVRAARWSETVVRLLRH